MNGWDNAAPTAFPTDESENATLFLLDEQGELVADFEGRLHTAAIPNPVIARFNADGRLAPFRVQWYWNSNGLQIVSVKHSAYIIYDEHGRNDRSRTIQLSTIMLPVMYDFSNEGMGGRLVAECSVNWRNLKTGQTGVTGVGVQEHSVRGDNPSKATIRAALPEVRLQVLAYLESRFRQFDNASLPLFGPPRGFGVMQLDTPPATARQLWVWRENVAAGIQLFNTKIGEVNNHFKNIYDSYPDAPKLTDEQFGLSIYQYYNGGFYWALDVSTMSWKKSGTTFYGDNAMAVEKLVRAGTPPADWN